MAFLDHLELKIIQGVNTAPGDTFSVENPLQVLNLMDAVSGISLQQNGWSPSIPALENSGIWADSPLSNGRKPLVMQESNVTEKMKLTITASSFLAMTKTLAAINAMAINARAFWTDNAQYDPVYLKWWASCGKGPQYALIFNMDLEYEYQDSQTPVIDVNLTIERESYWRWMPLGANPMQWAFEFNNRPYNVTNSQIDASSPLFSAVGVQNRSELNSSGAFRLLVTDNSFTIPASLIPGDAPALMQLIVTNTTTGTQYVFGKKTAKIVQYLNTATNNIMPQNLIFVCSTGTLGVDATATADTGASQNLSALQRRVEISFATATNQLRWNILGSLGSINRYIGRFMVFLRCRQSAGNVGDITMYLRYGANIATDSDGVKLNVAFPPVIAGAGNTTNWGLVYMGVITSPLIPGTAEVNRGGSSPSGLSGITPVVSFDLGLFALRSAGAGLLYINDVILIPIDEGAMQMEFGDATAVTPAIYDETSYLTHGTPDIQTRFGTPGTLLRPAKLSGNGIQLTPGIDNRIYMLAYDTNQQSVIAHTFNVIVNIIPRSRGIRDRATISG